MKITQLAIAILIITFGFGCKNSNDNKNGNSTSQIVSQKEDIKTGKDLSLMSAEDAIKTKFSKLQLSCKYEITSVVDGAQGEVLSYSKNEEHVWNILTETVLTKKLNIKDNFHGVTLNFISNLSLSLDSAFNVSITGTPGIANTTTFNSDNTTTITSGGNGNLFIINENEGENILEASFGPSSREEQSKIKIDCLLTSEINPEYK